MRLQFLAATTILSAFIATPVTSQTSQGTLQGSLSFPSERIPSLIVCAQEIKSKNSSIHCIQTQSEQKQYTINVPPGNYYVFASHITVDVTEKGFYTKFVLCGLKAGCRDHTLVPVSVRAGQVVKNINPMDFYGKVTR